jgi:Zn-dependent membrane protease YugP
MLADNGIRDVRVISVAGQLTDHWLTKQWILARQYNQRNAASAAVAAWMWTCGTTPWAING